MSDLNLAVRLTMNSKEFQAAMKAAEGQTRAFGKEAEVAVKGADRQIEATNKRAREFVGTLQSMATALAGGVGAGAFVQTLQAIQDTDTRLKGLTGSTREYAAAMDFVNNLAASHHKSVLTLADSYARMIDLQKAGVVTQQQAKDITRGLSDAQSATGASSEQLGQVMYGLSQALSSGTVRAEEFNQVTEPLPGLLQKMDQAAGLAAGGFRKLVNDGQVTSQLFAETLVVALRNYEGAAESTASNVSAKFADIGNAWQNLVRAVDASPLVKALGLVTDAIDKMTEAARYWEKQGGFINSLTGGAFQGTGMDAFSEDKQLQIYKADLARMRERMFGPENAGPLSITIPPKAGGGLADAKYDKTRAAAIADYLESRGLTPLQVAGIVGNLAQEAPGGQGTFGTAMSGDQGSVGIAQWRLDRKDAFVGYAGGRGAPVTDLKTQLDFLLAEAAKRGDLQAMLAARSPAESSRIFADRYERPSPAAANYDYRAAVASDIYDRSSLGRLKAADRAAGSASFDVERSLSEWQSDIDKLNAEFGDWQRKVRDTALEQFDSAQKDIDWINSEWAAAQRAERARQAQVADFVAQNESSSLEKVTAQYGPGLYGTGPSSMQSSDQSGLQGFVERYNAGIGGMEQYTFTAVNSMQNALSTFFETGIAGTESLGAAFAQLARRIAADIAAAMVTKGVLQLLSLAGTAMMPTPDFDMVAGTALNPTDAALGGGTAGALYPGAMLKASGGFVAGPGTSTSDSIPARLSNGEYVVRAAAVRSIGVRALDRINNLGVRERGFAAGGMVSEGAAGGAITLNMPITVAGGPGAGGGLDVNAARQLQRELRDAVDKRIVELRRPGGILAGR